MVKFHSHAIFLLHRAVRLYDTPTLPLKKVSEQAWKGGFQSGAEWMALALGVLRHTTINLTPQPYQALGITKYGIATLGGLVGLVWMYQFGWWLFPVVVGLFYFLEAQLVFLFPLAIDNFPHLFQTSLLATRYAGGGLKVMSIVLQLAVYMVLGGFFGQGFIRSWTIGCLAVLIWYEELGFYQRHKNVT
jgi:hypothetical protein